MVAVLLLDFHRDFMPREFVYSRAPEVLRIATLQRFILIGLVPLAIVLLLFRDDPRRYGLRIGDWRAGLTLAGIGTAVMLPIVIWAGHQPDFAAYYAPSIVERRRRSRSRTSLDVFGAEFCFRGFLMFTLIRTVGPLGIVLAAVPFTFAHLGKPELETVSTLLGGIHLRLARLADRLDPVQRDRPRRHPDGRDVRRRSAGSERADDRSARRPAPRAHRLVRLPLSVLPPGRRVAHRPRPRSRPAALPAVPARAGEPRPDGGDVAALGAAARLRPLPRPPGPAAARTPSSRRRCSRRPRPPDGRRPVPAGGLPGPLRRRRRHLRRGPARPPGRRRRRRRPDAWPRRCADEACPGRRRGPAWRRPGARRAPATRSSACRPSSRPASGRSTCASNGRSTPADEARTSSSAWSASDATRLGASSSSRFPSAWRTRRARVSPGHPADRTRRPAILRGYPPTPDPCTPDP